jgi:hypothetical protein
LVAIGAIPVSCHFNGLFDVCMLRPPIAATMAHRSFAFRPDDYIQLMTT